MKCAVEVIHYISLVGSLYINNAFAAEPEKFCSFCLHIPGYREASHTVICFCLYPVHVCVCESVTSQSA